MSISIYNYRDYKSYLKDYIASSSQSRGLMRKLAEAANCHPSYLTQTLNSKVQITQDHAIGLCGFMNLNAHETDFFFLLLDHARSGQPALRKMLETKMRTLKAQQEKLSQRLARTSAEDTEKLSVYYSSWMYSYVHILSSIPEFQTAEAIAAKLNVKTEEALNILKRLLELGLVLHERGVWKHSGKQIHIPESSHLVSLHHNNWRQRAILSSQLRKSTDLHFTGVYSISLTDYETVKNVLLKTIEKVNAVATNSGTEETITFCCDLLSDRD